MVTMYDIEKRNINRNFKKSSIESQNGFALFNLTVEMKFCTICFLCHLNQGSRSNDESGLLSLQNKRSDCSVYIVVSLQK